MSFDWNHSDDEGEDIDLAEWTRKAGYHIENEKDGDEVATNNGFALAKSSSIVSRPAASLYQYRQDSYSEGEDEDDDAVDWEDATSSVEDERKPAARVDGAPVTSLRPVQIDLNQTANMEGKPATEKSSAMKRPRRVTQFRVESLPHSMQSLLHNIHRTHLLALTSRAIHVSRTCSDSIVLAVAHSLISEEWSCLLPAPEKEWDKASSSSRDEVGCPSLSTLNGFMTWYTDFIHGVSSRRASQRRINMAAGAPGAATARRRPNQGQRQNQRRQEHNGENRTVPENSDALQQTPFMSTKERLLAMTSYLSVLYDRDPQLADEMSPRSLPNEHLYNVLLLAMVRSLGWRARFVQAIEPVPLDLTVDHPLLASSSWYAKVFSEVWTHFGKPSRKKQRRTEKPTIELVSSSKVIPASTHSKSLVSLQALDESPDPTLSWIEVLCVDPQVKGQRQRWIHVDAVHKLVDRPDQVEYLLEQSSCSSATQLSKSGSCRRLSKSTTKRSVAAYVVGAEHRPSPMPDGDGAGAIPKDDGDDVDFAATETMVRLTDVTPRYAASWVDSLRKRGIVRSKKCSIDQKVRRSWWTQTLQKLNGRGNRACMKVNGHPSKSGVSLDEAIVLDEDASRNGDNPPSDSSHEDGDEQETKELQALADSEAIPTSKAAFATHPKFVIASALGKAEVLAPDASKRVCGVFKGQLVFCRSDVSTALTAPKWLYEGRKVRGEEMDRPIKRRKVRKKPGAASGFKALRTYGVGATNDGDEERQIQQGSERLSDGMEDLFAIWQTDPWSPAPVGPADPIPVNEFKNIELALLNPGLVHIDRTGLATVAKKLDIPYAPCLLGFEGHGGNRTPTVRGIVVHEHNAQLVREAGIEVSSHAIERQCQDRRTTLLLHWKRLMVGLLTKARLDREYGADEPNDE